MFSRVLYQCASNQCAQNFFTNSVSAPSDGYTCTRSDQYVTLRIHRSQSDRHGRINARTQLVKYLHTHNIHTFDKVRPYPWPKVAPLTYIAIFKIQLFKCLHRLSLLTVENQNISGINCMMKRLGKRSGAGVGGRDNAGSSRYDGVITR
eukprot:5766909-Pyramimonas_sp.AAC.3